MPEAASPSTSGLTWPTVLGPLVRGDDVGPEGAAWAMERILAGDATAAQVAGFAVALRAKGESVAELTALADTMFAHARRLEVSDRVVDIVGTGGDLAHTVNISTMSAVVIAGAGAGVVKHGNRAASSSSGAADVLEALGVRLDVPVENVLDVYREAGITFCFAPLFHASFRHTAAPRRELGIPTPFNLLGPLTNPARPAAMAVGCADRRMAPVVAGVLAGRGTDALVFRGDDGLDEITVSTTTTAWVAAGGAVREATIDPRALGLDLSPLEALRGGEPQENAAVFRRLLEGEPGAVRDAVLMNAASALAAHAGDLDDLDAAMARGIERARESIDSGAASRVLQGWAEATRRHLP
ncbi:anthranilate phosphoribosyltransferase [Aeromicrobium halocynthiae]|uniref:anthranilate phosphoribosyltransferase n=1 Tax=Aeromicrobium halocynthiae TaxID=560557 RepID=UPI0031DCBE3F